MTDAEHPGTLALGGSRARGPRTMAIPRTTEGPESRFVFRFDRIGGWVQPSGFIDGAVLREVVVGERAAAGGIVLVSEGPSEVRFAVGDADSRRLALRHLDGWASMNRVAFVVLAETVPLRPFPGRWDEWACTRCGRPGPSFSATAMPYAPLHRWRRTLCPCGGHQLPCRQEDV